MEIGNRVFIVTGASSGIGLATAKSLAAQGGKVALLARTGSVLHSLSEELPDSLAIAVDVTDSSALRNAITEIFRHFGRIDGLINNAGQSYAATVEEIDTALFDDIFHLNVLAPIVGMQALIPKMRAQGSGSIVNVNSGTAFMTIPGYSVYSSSKRALLGFTQTARAELAADNIVVSEVYPFITDTNFGRNRIGGTASAPASNYHEGDSPEFVAGIILQAIAEGGAQYFANDRLKHLAGF